MEFGELVKFIKLRNNKNITVCMINKAVGYSGFKTYGELPYPTRKQGK